MNTIKLNEILRLSNLEGVKIRFTLQFEENWDPIEYFKKGNLTGMLESTAVDGLKLARIIAAWGKKVSAASPVERTLLSKGSQ